MLLRNMAQGRQVRREIERKFLMLKPAIAIEESARREGSLVAVKRIEQRYLAETGAWTIRIRTTTHLMEDDRTEHVLTFKMGLSDASSIEIETEVTEQVRDDLACCCGYAVRKIRTCVMIDGFLWEIDRFLNPEIQGMELVEIELPDERTQFPRPEWLGEEVTHLKRYRNARIEGILRA